ncbi:hypothetical protein FN846DRAFT_912414 [Sphaerosporella brunnea]|uniref:Uncharacterized protein n=1 Tax=Sphaerosporella brunnea TaxID=1250544 RepID=A0A5J5EJG3_9PEZI|nr:hypothetical protein FN846DRAFT_912414 [Sphaerosporella brunnea]
MSFAPKNTPAPEAPTAAQIVHWWKRLIASDLKGLSRFYDGCKRETVLHLTLLALYELVALVARRVPRIIDQPGFRGVARIGTESQYRILKPFADPVEMRRLLLVMIFTDGAIEGERKGLPTDVITKKARDIEK